MSTAKELPIQQNRLVHAGFLLVCLCLVDAVFTDYGLRLGYIEEANLLVAFLYERSISVFYVVKVGLPLILLYIVAVGKAGVWVRVFMATALFLYIAVLFFHIFWMVLITI